MTFMATTPTPSDTEPEHSGAEEPETADSSTADVPADCQQPSPKDAKRRGRSQVVFNGPLELLRRKAMRANRRNKIAKPSVS